MPASAAGAESATPARITGRLPKRSVAHPLSGANAYIPAMWRLWITPTMRSVCAGSWPAPITYTGVIAITPTITRWATAVAAMPSRASGRSRTALAAALAHGLPVVAYRGVETASPFVDGDNILLAPRDDTAALAACTARVLGSPELRRRLSAGARDLYCRHFTWHAIAQRFLEAVA